MSGLGKKALRAAHDEHGAMSVVTLVFAVFLVAMLYYLIGVGEALLYRQRLQDAADAAAFSSAVMHARGMNLIALINVTMAALLAVLVALRIVEVLLVVAMILIAAASVFPPNPGGFALIGMLEALHDTVHEAREIASRVVHPTLAMLHTTELLVRDVTPGTASGLAGSIVKQHYAPPAELGVAIPARLTLPVEDAPFSLLCRKATGFVAALTLDPLEGALGGIGKVALGPVRAAVEDLAEAAPEWFCGATDAKVSMKVDESYPKLPAQEDCLAAIDDVDGSPSDSSIKTACDAAEQEAVRSSPDEDTGECIAPSCDRKLYLLRAERARKLCDPEERGLMHDYVVQLRTTRYAFLKNTALSDRPNTVTDLSLVTWDQIDCPYENGRWQWHTPMHDGNSGDIVPVCTVSTRTLPDSSEEVVEALHVFGCSKRVDVKPPVGDASDGVAPKDGEENAEAAQRLAAGVVLGGETFQIRGVAIGAPRCRVSQRVIDVARFGRTAERVEFPDLPVLSRVAVAQAEYYFDAPGADGDAAVWETKWKARLRRFRLPGSSSAALGSACDAADASFPDSGVSCRSIVRGLSELAEWIAH